MSSTPTLTSIKQWRVTAGGPDFDALESQDAPIPKIGDNDVLIKLHAASLNYRDLAIARVRLTHTFPIISTSH
jgi:NADPH:quinone reductase-like Zn-dependent oxidoreductase